MLRTLRKIVAASLIGLALTSAVAAQEPQYGGTLKLWWGTLDTTDFHRHTGTISLTHPFAETLTSISKDGQPKPFLAESWTVSEDGKVYTFKIRRGVKFHNGDTLTAADVMANFVRIRDKVKGGWLTTALEQVEDFSAADDQTFVVKLKAPFAPFLNLIAEAWILSPKSPGWDDAITHPIGTGPFTFDHWTPQLVLKGKKFQDYWMPGKPYVDAVEFDVREIADASLGLRAGDYQGASVSLGKLATLQADPNITTEFRGDTNWQFITFNNRAPRPPFDNVRVREAVIDAIDNDAVLKIAYGDHGIKTNQMAAPGNFYYDKALDDADIHKTAHVDKAKQILAEEGVDPTKVTINMIVTQNDRFSPPIMQMLKKVGFNIDAKSYDDLGYQKALSAYDRDMYPGGSGPRNDIFLRFVRMMADGPNPGLWGGVQDPEYDALVKQAIETVDDNKRRDFYLQAWKRVMDRYYTVVVGHVPEAYAYRRELHDMTIGFNSSAHRVDGGIAFAWLEH
jgi:ABC-type transport system substrate-binding protein